MNILNGDPVRHLFIRITRRTYKSHVGNGKPEIKSVAKAPNRKAMEAAMAAHVAEHVALHTGPRLKKNWVLSFPVQTRSYRKISNSAFLDSRHQPQNKSLARPR